MSVSERPVAQTDAEYFQSRALEEKAAAVRVAPGAARKVHDQLAMLYRLKAAMLSRRPESWSEALGAEVSETA